MNKVLVAVCTLLFALGASPSYAELNPGEKAAYGIGYEWGLITAACIYFKAGLIPPKVMVSAFEMIGSKSENSEKVRDTIFRTIHDKADDGILAFKPCSEQLELYQIQQTQQ